MNQDNTLNIFKDVKSAFWDYSALILGKIGVALLVFVSLSFLTRILGPENYGKFSLFLMVTQVLIIVLVTWTSASIIRFGKEEYTREGKINEVFWSRTLILIPFFILGVLGVLLFKHQIISYIGMPSWIIWLTIAYFFIYSASEFLYYIFQATNHLKTLALVEFFENLFLVGGLILTKFFISSSVFILAIIIGIYILSKFLINLIFLFRLNLKIFFPIKIEKTVIKRILIFSYPLIFGAIAGYFSKWVDIGVIKKYLEVSQIGFFSLSFKISSLLGYFGFVLNIVLLPMMIGFLSRGRKDLINLYIRRIIPQVIFFWGIVLFFVFIFSQPLILILSGEEFSPSILPFTILIIGSFVSILSYLYGSVLVTFELIKQVTIINILMAGFNFGLDLLLVPQIGIQGAAIAKSFVFSFGGITYLFLANRFLGLKEYKQLLIPLPFVVFFVINILFPGAIFLIGGTVILAISLFLIAKYLNLISQEDKRILGAIDMPIFLRRLIYKAIDKFSPLL